MRNCGAWWLSGRLGSLRMTNDSNSKPVYSQSFPSTKVKPCSNPSGSRIESLRQLLYKSLLMHNFMHNCFVSDMMNVSNST